MNDPFDYIPDAECDEAFRRLTARIELLRRSDADADIDFCRELDEGKMLGVLVAADRDGNRHTLYAFSGQFGDGGFYQDGFVGPVFDYLQPDGHFKTGERDISLQTLAIKQFEDNVLKEVKHEYQDAEDALNAEISDYKEKCRQSKLERDARRKSGGLSDAELAEMIRRSQFEKAELHRMKKKAKAELEPLATKLKDTQSHLDALKGKRRHDSENLQQWLFSNFKVLNALGESKSLSEIFAKTPMKIPPSGAGECCAPKLFQAAYLKDWTPVAMAEYWYGKPKGGELRIHGRHYPACRGKCLPILSWMLQGLDVEHRDGGVLDIPEPKIIFENQWFCVVDKPSGMLSVPGKGHAMSLQKWLQSHYGPDRDVKMAHRLDQDTSGLIIATFGELPYKTMQALFARREVKKTYIADLEGDYTLLGIPKSGRIELPLAPDWLDRPRQKVDFEDGKEAVTEYEFGGVSDGRSRILFHPLTGRTHQLRVHAASPHGLGMPIVGDRLYGSGHSHCSDPICDGTASNYLDRLHLHARQIEFTFPLDSRHYSFTSSIIAFPAH